MLFNMAQKTIRSQKHGMDNWLTPWKLARVQVYNFRLTILRKNILENLENAKIP